MSTVIMSPFFNILLSGIPWHTTLLTEVQIDLGKPLKRKGDGYALFCITKLCIYLSSSSVVKPSLKLKILLYYI